MEEEVVVVVVEEEELSVLRSRSAQSWDRSGWELHRGCGSDRPPKPQPMAETARARSARNPVRGPWRPSSLSGRSRHCLEEGRNLEEDKLPFRTGGVEITRNLDSSHCRIIGPAKSSSGIRQVYFKMF